MGTTVNPANDQFVLTNYELLTIYDDVQSANDR